MTFVPEQPSISPGLAPNSPAVPCWKSPPASSLKVNVDAAFSHDNGAGFGLVIRDNRGLLIAVACHRPVPQLNPTLAEANCLQWAMTMCLELNILNVIFEIDCLAIKQSWESTGSSASYLQMVMEDCKSLSDNFHTSQVLHVKRNCNKAADLMSKYALSFVDHVWFTMGRCGLGTNTVR